MPCPYDYESESYDCGQRTCKCPSAEPVEPCEHLPSWNELKRQQEFAREQAALGEAVAKALLEPASEGDKEIIAKLDGVHAVLIDLSALRGAA